MLSVTAVLLHTSLTLCKVLRGEAHHVLWWRVPWQEAGHGAFSHMWYFIPEQVINTWGSP